eukprot:TRINITY_DN5870_c0_g1_i4.p1 TRINITY_DN5870_c0_g1~~TRINITY_DN5870_c0_g1_i4.p1  ORF type:complete len:161 (-),score=34.15 TRINITY_DN5870_c0_g1_i4:71-496(-)
MCIRDRIWSLKTSEKINELRGVHEGSITHLALSSDNQRVLTTSRDGTVKLVDMRMTSVVMTYRHDAYSNSFEFNKATFGPGENSIIAGGSDGQLFVWNMYTGRMERTIPTEHEGGITSCSLNQITGYLVTADVRGNVFVWN